MQASWTSDVVRRILTGSDHPARSIPSQHVSGFPPRIRLDAYAVRLTKEGIEIGFHGSLRGAQLDFFFMPLMHSDSLSDHDPWLNWGTEEIGTRASIARLLPDLAASRTETRC